MNYAIINKDGKIVNVIWYEGGKWSPPEGHIMVRTDVAGIDDLFDHATGNIHKTDGSICHHNTDYETYISGKGYIKHPSHIDNVSIEFSNPNP